MATRPNPSRVLTRTYCHLTHTWLAPGCVPLAAELVEPVLAPGATVADLIVLLGARDRLELELGDV